MQAPKNGFFYVLDRATGEFISAEDYAYQTWAKGIDDRRPPGPRCRGALLARRRWCSRRPTARTTGTR